ncbi:MAG: ATP-binding cassette domain-containing protein [Alphaproteobacteria bacterium]
MSEARALSLHGISLTIGGHTLFPPLDCTVSASQAVTVMGPSGCGKSSLLACICGTLDKSFAVRGEVRLDGQRIDHLPPEHRGVGILFQDELLFPHLTVGGNLAFGLGRHIASGRAERRRLVEQALAEAGLEGFAGRDPATLSGGQRARVSVMRALLAHPRALLLDEPFSRLDSGLRDRFRRFVFDHARERGLPVLLVTHDPDDAAAAGGPVIQLGRTPPTDPLAEPAANRAAGDGMA